MRRYLLGLVLILFSLCAKAQIIYWDNTKDFLDVGKNVQILEDKEGIYSINEVASKELSHKFISSKKSIINFGYTESIHWLKFTLQNITTDSLLLEIAHASLPIADIYYKNKEGDFSSIKGGYRIPMNEKNIIHHYQIFPLHKGNSEFYIRVLSNSHPLPLRIWKHKSYNVRTYSQRLIYGFYFGFMLFVIITNIFFFFSLRNRIYLFYAFVVMIYICYASMVMDGFILYLFPKLDMMFWYVTIPTIGVAVQTAYCLTFLEAKKYVRKVNKVVKYVIGYFIMYLLLRPFIPFTLVLALNTVHALMSFFIMGYVGVRVGKKGNRMGYYYAIAYGIYFTLVVIEAIYIQTGTPPYFLGLSHVAFATLIEAFILSYLLSKRSEWERADSEREKLLAQEALFKTVQENERIVTEQNVILEEKVAKRTQSLNEANKELGFAIATKDKFFSIIAHDLKSPFNSLLGMSDLLVNGYDNYTEDDKKKYLKVISTGLVNTHDLLDNLLLWSQSQRGSIAFIPEKICLSDLLKETLSYLKQHSESKDITLTNNIKNGTYVNGDRNMLMTILRNILTNSIKFTSKGGKVHVDLIEDPDDDKADFLTVAICDNGIGISHDRQDKLFKLSTNVSTNGTNNESGTGLGLIICKEFVERHGGKIWVESEPGKGSSFCLTIPKN
ncbi:hypothetical protein E9993_10650 [Labilibacter sediminis]|nr:hypothetical protein E9993_10650 [Labilibacter sediminis]